MSIVLSVHCSLVSSESVLMYRPSAAVHRLVAALAFMLRLSPSFEGQLASMLEVLESKKTLKSKVEKGGCGEAGVQKPEVRKLIEEVAEKLCP